MVKTLLEKEIKWYRSAVKGALVIKAGILEEDAERVIQAYNLDNKMQEDPYIGLHYDPEDVAEEMISRGLVSAYAF